MTPKYPNVSVDFSNQDGNAFAVMETVTRALKKARIPETEIKLFRQEAMSGDYDNVLQTCFKWVNVEFDESDNQESCEDYDAEDFDGAVIADLL